MPYKGMKLRPSQIAFLGAVMLENIQTNYFCKYTRVVELVGKGVINWKGIQVLIDIGLLHPPVYGKYCVTAEGEYFLRNIETFCARIVYNLPLSKWRKIRGENDIRAKYVRGSQKTVMA